VTLLKDVAIVGLGETPVGKVPDLSCTQMYVQALISAVQDAGLALSDIDGLITGNSRPEPHIYHANVIAEYLQIRPSHVLTVNTGGSTSVQMLKYAAALIGAGFCNNVAVVMADKLATGMGRNATVESMATIAHPQFEAPYGPIIPALYALLAQRYMWCYGIDPRQVAEVAVTDRFHAAIHGAAQYVSPITVEDVVGSRLVADPLHLLECAPISDAGCAIVVSRADRARSMKRAPVRILGVGEAASYENVSQAPDLTVTTAVESGRQAFRMAGLTPSDIDVAMIYDAFAFIMCMEFEDLGFCAKGEGAAFVASGQTRLGGALPTNTHGGILSHSHAGRPSALFLIVEAVRQLRGECGARQVPNARRAVVHAEGGIMASHATAILGSDD
jgi:acetyl-CoA acetyltransferase